MRNFYDLNRSTLLLASVALAEIGGPQNDAAAQEIDEEIAAVDKAVEFQANMDAEGEE